MHTKPAVEDREQAIDEARVGGFPNCIGRRQFLLSGASAAVCTLLLPAIGGLAPREVQAIENGYPRKLIGKVSQLQEGVQVPFTYPDDTMSNFLVKLGTEAGRGIGTAKDIVAFNSLCTHMGGPLLGLYKHEHRAVGPCIFHLTTFDLTRFGIVIAGHASESLTQVMLEVEGDDIYATGFAGLVYGEHSNL